MIDLLITRKIDNLFRLVIPKDLRDKLKIQPGDEIEFFYEDNYICLRKKDYTPTISCENCPYKNNLK